MSERVIGTGQGITKDCVVGDRLMNRYGVFNGLMRPRRINSDGAWEILGVQNASAPTSLTAQAGGSLTPAHWYSYKAVYASMLYTRPVAVLDGTGNMTRGNPSDVASRLLGAGQSAVSVVIPTIAQDGITHVLLYRSLAGDTQGEAEAGPFFYVGMADNVGASVTILDTVDDDLVGLEVETDNYYPSAWRWACVAQSYIFAAGNFLIGTVATCTVTPGSDQVTIDGEPIYDGVIGWRFKLVDDVTGGSNGGGLYFANYVDSTTIQLVDSTGVAMAYNGSKTGSGLSFSLYLPGNVLRWCKKGEPESWPTENLIDFEGDVTGIIQMPNQPLVLVITDEPSIYVLDLNIIGTDAFKQNKHLISTTNLAYHFSLCAVEGKIRGIDPHHRCIIETDGAGVEEITNRIIPRVWDYFDYSMNKVKLWHCVYDPNTHLFGAFVSYKNSLRLIDFCVGQHVVTGGWFFNWEKDLLCSCMYRQDPITGYDMILGGTEGCGNGSGGVWGRIWCPDVYSEWIPSGCLTDGDILSADATRIVVDPALGAFGDLVGRWVLVTDANGEYAQLGYIVANTVDTLIVNATIGGLSNYNFDPVPDAGWKFYVGMIECRWGPKRFDFGDPDVAKKVWELWCTVSNHDESALPKFRLYRGFEAGYAEQLKVFETRYLDRTQAQSLVNHVDNKLESVPRWGMMWLERSYNPTTLHSLTIVFSKVQ